MKHEIQHWHYNTHQVVTRIPKMIGVQWMIGYGVNLIPFECVPATSEFSGAHMGDGSGPELLLALSDCGYCLVKLKHPQENDDEV